MNRKKCPWCWQYGTAEFCENCGTVIIHGSGKRTTRYKGYGQTRVTWEPKRKKSRSSKKSKRTSS